MKETLIYTCPMHQEVESDQPGNCPKCGMKLVPKGAVTRALVTVKQFEYGNMDDILRNAPRPIVAAICD
jgi:DNA-directed RNA polymerase subunit RPC12/RpoP